MSDVIIPIKEVEADQSTLELAARIARCCISTMADSGFINGVDSYDAIRIVFGLNEISGQKSIVVEIEDGKDREVILDKEISFRKKH